mmetsp:Transcript_18265/g.45446  ORF Transcript_18265/g.45446 Transcript_18265/m.45446 type:complete len:236 (+) Transcript_18265:1146-1853(+)
MTMPRPLKVAGAGGGKEEALPSPPALPSPSPLSPLPLPPAAATWPAPVLDLGPASAPGPFPEPAPAPAVGFGYFGALRLNALTRRVTTSTSARDMRRPCMTKSCIRLLRDPFGSETPRSAPRDALKALARVRMARDGLSMFGCPIVSVHSLCGLGVHSGGFSPTMGASAHALSQLTGLVPQPLGAAIVVVVSLSSHRQYPASIPESLPHSLGLALMWDRTWGSAYGWQLPARTKP